MRRFAFYVFCMLLAVVPGQSGLFPPTQNRFEPAALIQVPEQREMQLPVKQPQEDGANFGPPAPPEPQPPTTVQAVDVAVADAEKLNFYDRRYIRYVWCPDGNFKNANVGLNIISRSAAPIRALPIAQGLLLRVDLRIYARFFAGGSKESAKENINSDVEEWLRYWEHLKYDPTFNLLITKDNARFAAGKLPNQKVSEGAAVKTRRLTIKQTVRKRVPCQPYRADDGIIYDYEIKKVEEEVEIDVEDDNDEKTADFIVLRLNPDYLPRLQKLQQLMYSEAPIVFDRYFLARVLTTIKVDPVSKDTTAWTVIWGGLYYEFRGIKRSNQRGVTDEDLFLKLFGITNVTKFFDQLQTDQRCAIFKSEVTGRNRRVDFFNTPSGRAWDVMGIGSITHDIRAEDTDVATHPLMNLLTFKDAAREDIFVGPNGMHVYAIFDGTGKLLDEAVINIVSDRTVPSPHPPRLQCALSCIACHEADGSDGWKSVGNDVKKLLSNRVDLHTGQQQLDLDVMTDLTQKDQLGLINRLAGLYAGDFSKGMRRSRDDYAEAILKVSGPQKGESGADQTNIVKTTMVQLVGSTRSYIYNEVTPKQACWELGLRAGANPAKTLQEHLPPEPANIGFAPEDPRLAALKRNIAIPRTDWAYVQSFAAARVTKHANHTHQK